MPDRKQRYGPWALITGASDGIGRAFAYEVASKGISTILVARRRPLLEEIAAELRRIHGVQVEVVVADLAKADQVEAALAEADKFDVGLFIAAAGFGTSGEFVEGNLSDELQMIDVNCRAVAAMTHHLAGRFRVRRRGGIILMSSLVAFQGVPRAANYAATKAYIQSLAEALRLELRPLGVDVIASAPGPVASGFAARASMTMASAETPQRVATETLRTLGSRGLVRPGLLAKLLEASLKLLPRFGRVRIMRIVMAGMTRRTSSSHASAQA
jgi:short-subunit dehydrogenase